MISATLFIGLINRATSFLWMASGVRLLGGAERRRARYLLQIAPFLGTIAFILVPQLTSARLLALAAMAVIHIVALRLRQLNILSRTEVVSRKVYEYRYPLRVSLWDSSPEGSNNFHSQRQSFP